MATGFSSQTMTLISAGLAALTFVATNFPDDMPWWVNVGVGEVLAFGNVVIGISHPGTGTRQTRPARTVNHRIP